MSTLIDFIKRHPLASGASGLVAVALGAWLAFGFFGVQGLFIDEQVSEANPFSAGPGPSGLAADETSEDLAREMNDAMQEQGMSGDAVVDEPMTADVTTLGEGTFIDRAHATSGTAKVITDGDRTFLRLEDFETDNGPDLNVYLSTAGPEGTPDDFIDLGDLKGNIGDQNYELTDDIDLDRYQTVFIWCVRFGVTFGAAPLS